MSEPATLSPADVAAIRAAVAALPPMSDEALGGVALALAAIDDCRAKT